MSTNSKILSFVPLLQPETLIQHLSFIKHIENIKMNLQCSEQAGPMLKQYLALEELKMQTLKETHSNPTKVHKESIYQLVLAENPKFYSCSLLLHPKSHLPFWLELCIEHKSALTVFWTGCTHFKVIPQMREWKCKSVL